MGRRASQFINAVTDENLMDLVNGRDRQKEQKVLAAMVAAVIVLLVLIVAVVVNPRGGIVWAVLVVVFLGLLAYLIYESGASKRVLQDVFTENLLQDD
jgi:uncharacterized membrane protein YdbT with pleckstrin-like domain